MTSPNHFLASLSAPDLAALAPALTPATLKRDQLIAEAGEDVRTVYLPLDSILSVITVMRDGVQVESRTIGRESGYGLLHALGARRSYERMICQVGGEAMTIPAPALAAAADQRPSLVAAIVRHAQATQIQTSQTLACNTLHAAQPRMASWLLMTQDRLGRDVVPLTQEHLAIMLGVQRTTVTVVAQALQDMGAIHYRRGRITILDRDMHRRESCECYADVEDGVAAALAG